MKRNEKLKLQPSTQSPCQKLNFIVILLKVAKKQRQTFTSNQDFQWNILIPNIFCTRLLLGQCSLVCNVSQKFLYLFWDFQSWKSIQVFFNEQEKVWYPPFWSCFFRAIWRIMNFWKYLTWPEKNSVRFPNGDKRIWKERNTYCNGIFNVNRDVIFRIIYTWCVNKHYLIVLY